MRSRARLLPCPPAPASAGPHRAPDLPGVRAPGDLPGVRLSLWLPGVQRSWRGGAEAGQKTKTDRLSIGDCWVGTSQAWQTGWGSQVFLLRQFI